ncbi:hypothetical protein IRJ41_014214 [Triplophysa rosa]|uniref:Uncharacterized protein n=1 Tax=Triplophysa rosa TaxID=992332 RepID=A0A9W8C630_TRIRA|nr:hypothetical protein IRJ41_014214 [Triplophysa rosa]
MTALNLKSNAGFMRLKTQQAFKTNQQSFASLYVSANWVVFCRRILIGLRAHKHQGFFQPAGEKRERLEERSQSDHRKTEDLTEEASSACVSVCAVSQKLRDDDMLGKGPVMGSRSTLNMPGSQ